jgi:hypothetical protein
LGNYTENERSKECYHLSTERRGGGAMNSIDEAIFRPFSFDGGEFGMPSANVAEVHAKAHDGSAAYFEDKGRADLVNKQRKLAALWRGLAALSEADANRLCDEFFFKGTENIDSLLALEGKSASSLLYLGLLATRALNSLLDLAVHGHKQALRAFMGSIGDAVNNFEFVASRKPELFREWAKRSIAIPGLISRNRAQAKYNEQLLELLQQGAESHLAFLPTGKRGRMWQFEGANLLAVRLIAHIQSSNRSYKTDKRLARSNGTKIPAWRIRATKLKPFSAQAWLSWAEVAWEMLAQISPAGKPALHPAFYDRETKICNVRKTRKNPYYGNKETGHSIAEQDIKEALFGAFQVIATGKSPRTRQRQKAAKSKKQYKGEKVA